MTYIEQLELRINETRKELESIFEQKFKLKNNNSSYQKSILNIEIDEKLNNTNKKLQDYLKLYDASILVNTYINDLKNLVELYQKEENPILRDEISKEINNKRNYIYLNIKTLPENIKNELKESFKKVSSDISLENKNTEENNSLIKTKEDLAQRIENLENEIAKYQKEMQSIFQEERDIKENNLFKSNKELDDFLIKYMQKKLVLNKKISEQKKKLNLLNTRLLRLNNQIISNERMTEESSVLNISKKEFNNILNRNSNKKELEEYFKRLGLDKTKERNMIEEALKKEKIDNSNIINVKDSKRALPNNKVIKELEPKDIANVIDNLMPDITIKNEKYNDEIATYGYKTIIRKLINGLEPKKKDGKRYKAANIDVKESFKQELQSGNYLYNIVHVVPAVIKLPVGIIRKATSKITYNKEIKERMETIKRRLDNLNDQDLMIIFKEYSNHAEIERYGSGINTLIEERISRFIDERVKNINKDLEIKYQDVYQSIKELESIDNLLRDQSLSKYLKNDYLNYRSALLDGKSSLIASIRKDYNEAKTLLSGGLHGFKENLKATETKMSYVGKRFAKDHDLDVELLDKEAKLERAEKRAIQDGNDEMALRVFVQAESLLCKNTTIEKSIFGNRSTGKKYYSPLAEKLDYRNDHFIRDIFTTIVMVSATQSAIHSIDAQKQIIERQKEIEAINTTKSSIEDITTDYASGNITSLEALNELNQISASSQNRLATIADQSLPNLIDYAKNNSQFDLVGAKDAMDYVVANPVAIQNFNKPVLDIAELGEEFTALTVEQINALQSMPLAIKENLFAAATAASLAISVSNTINNNYKKGKYGNNITQLVKNYVEHQEKVKESQSANKKR